MAMVAEGWASSAEDNCRVGKPMCFLCNKASSRHNGGTPYPIKNMVTGDGRDPWRQCRGGAAQVVTAAAVLVVPQLNGHSWADLFSRNYVFKAGFCAWLLAQTAKVEYAG